MFLTTAYKSEVLKLKLDEDPQQCLIYFPTVMESLKMITSHYKETCEVFLYYPTIGGEYIKDYVNKAIRNIQHANIDVYSRHLIYEFLLYEVNFMSKLHFNSAIMNVSDRSIYDRLFRQV